MRKGEDTLMGLIQQMKKQENMTERERDICNYMLEHPERVETISSRELGHATFTSAASVTRLCQKLGQKDFRNLSYSLYGNCRMDR